MVSSLIQQICDFVVGVVPVPAVDNILQQVCSGVISLLQGLSL